MNPYNEQISDQFQCFHQSIEKCPRGSFIVVDHQFIDNNLQYLIRYSDFPARQDEWINQNDLYQIIHAFPIKWKDYNPITLYWKTENELTSLYYENDIQLSTILQVIPKPRSNKDEDKKEEIQGDEHFTLRPFVSFITAVNDESSDLSIIPMKSYQINEESAIIAIEFLESAICNEIVSDSIYPPNIFK